MKLLFYNAFFSSRREREVSAKAERITLLRRFATRQQCGIAVPLRAIACRMHMMATTAPPCGGVFAGAAVEGFAVEACYDRR